MKAYYLIYILVLSTSCGQNYNSHTSDAQTYGVNVSSGDADFDAAKAILVSKCASCHEGWHDRYATFNSSAEFDAGTTTGTIVPGDSASSQLITRLINKGSDMPKGGSALSDAEVLILETWINGMSN